MTARDYYEVIDELATLYEQGMAVNIATGLRIMGYIHKICLSWDEDDVNNVKDWCMENDIDAIIQRTHINFKIIEDAVAFKMCWGELEKRCNKHGIKNVEQKNQT